MSTPVKRPAAAKKASRGKQQPVETPAESAPVVVTQPAEPAPVVVTQPAEPAPVVVPQPTEPAPEAPQPAESAAGLAQSAESGKQEQSESDGIRPARVRHLMDSELLNKAINNAIADSKAVCKLAKQLEKELKTGKVVETVQTIENSQKKSSKVARDITDAERASRMQQLAALADKYKAARSVVEAHKPYRTRFSTTTAAAVTGYADYMVGRLFTFAGANLVAAGAKTLSREHFLHESLRAQDFYPLVADLPVVRDSLVEYHKNQMKQQHAREVDAAVKAAVKAAEREIYRENKGLRKKKQPRAEQPKAEQPTQVEQAGPEEDSPRGEFRTYIAAAWKQHSAAQNTANSGKASRYKFGGDAKQFLCDLIEQLIANVTYLMDLQAQFNDTKTINEKSVTHVIRTKLVNVGAVKREESLTMDDGLVVDPVALKAARATGVAFDINNLPKVPGKVVTRVVLYKSPLLDDIQASINKACEKNQSAN